MGAVFRKVSKGGVAFGSSSLQSASTGLQLHTGVGLTLKSSHFYCQTYFNLKQVREDADYAVFDDLAGGFKFWPGYKSWLGAQKEFDITDKYQGKRHVKWGKPGICLMNSDPLFDPHVDTEWLIGNCFIIFVPESEPLVSDVSS